MTNLQGQGLCTKLFCADYNVRPLDIAKYTFVIKSVAILPLRVQDKWIWCFHYQSTEYAFNQRGASACLLIVAAPSQPGTPTRYARVHFDCCTALQVSTRLISFANLHGFSIVHKHH